jgi:inward rectifier potassium channel
LELSSWPLFLACLALAHLTLNTVFAMLYLAHGNAIANARPGSFADAFFFSVETKIFQEDHFIFI